MRPVPPVLLRLLMALTGGTMLFAAHPPIDAGWLGYVALVPLVALCRDLAATGRPFRAGFGWGSLAGLVAFGPLLYWLLPFGVAAFGLLVVVQAMWLGLFVGLGAVYGERLWRPAVVVALWVGIEAARGVWPLGGFGWGGLGYTQHAGGPLLGVARTLGVHGVSLCLATIAVASEAAIRTGSRTWPAAREAEIPAEHLFGAIRTPLLVVLGTLSMAVLLTGETPTSTGRAIEVGIAQGGDTRATAAAGVNRLDSDRIQRVAELALQATRPFAADPPDLVIWPENSLDIDIRTPRGAPIADLLEEGLAAVAPTPILAGEYIGGPRSNTLFNRMTVFTQEGEGESYVKRKPVPFGEYVPARELLDWFPPLEQIPNDTLPGDEAQVLEVAGAHIGGVICFENIFPMLVRDQVLAGADLIVVSTNNSSFGDTPMSAQHLAFSTLRAVETGRWVVHAGISGISAFISPDGEVLERTELFEPASPRMEVPLLDGTTMAMRLGSLVPGLAQLVAVAALALVLGERVRGRRDSED